MPQAAIEELLLDDERRDFESGLTVPPGQHRLEIEYTAPVLRGGERVRFRYRLGGLEKDWVQAGNRRYATYDYLSPGHYDFQVEACDAKGVWNSNAASVGIEVRPAFWQTLWFRGLLIVAVCGAAFGWYQARVSRLEARRREQQEFTQQLISAQEAERARLARELHDDITQRLARLAIDAGRAEQTGHGSPVGETMRSVREGLVQVSADVHSLSYKLHPSLLEDLGLVQAIRAECERFTRQENIPCKVNLCDLPSILSRPAALGLFRIAQEALRNIARHAGATTVEVTLRPLDDGLQLAIQDNGRGFDPSLKRKRTSLGLASMRERMQLLEGELEVESVPGEGATILAWVPASIGEP